MLPPDEAFARIQAAVKPTSAEEAAYTECMGRVLAQDVVATNLQPAHDNSAMDGFAVRHADVAGATPASPVILHVLEDIPAGKVPQLAVGAGQASRIMTGALVPEGADTVLIQENADVLEASTIEVAEPPAKGAHIRLAGVDFAEGQTLLPSGTLLSPGSVALAASGGHPELVVRAKPRVVVLSTGDELVMPGETPGPDQIIVSNTFGLHALLTDLGAEPRLLPIARDSESALRTVLGLVDDADLVITREDPSAAPAALRSIEHVVRRGVLVREAAA